MNKVVLMGRLTKDPEIRYTQTSNVMVANFNLAVNRRFARQGEERKADFISIIAWKATAEFCSKYFKKGQQVGVIGRFETDSYDDKDGKKVYTTYVVAEEVYFADSNKNTNTDPFANNTEQQPASQGTFPNVNDDDLPF